MKKIRLVLVLIAIIIIGFTVWYFSSISAKSKDISEKVVTIPLGTGSSGIANILKDNDIIKSEIAFKLYVKINKVDNFQATAIMFNSILGDGANSMLFQNVREKASLAYTVASSYIKNRNTFIDGKKYKKTNNKRRSIKINKQNEKNRNNKIRY